MAKALEVLDRVALVLTGGGLLGAGFAAIDILPTPAGMACAAAVAVGGVGCVIVRVLAPVPDRTVVEAQGSWLDHEYPMNFPHDTLRLKNAATDPTDPSVPGTLNWQATQDSVAKTF